MIGRDINWALARVRIVKRENHDEQRTNFWEANCFDKFCFIVEVPFSYLRSFTIPSGCDDNYNKYISMVHPFTVPPLFMW